MTSSKRLETNIMISRVCIRSRGFGSLAIVSEDQVKKRMNKFNSSTNSHIIRHIGHNKEIGTCIFGCHIYIYLQNIAIIPSHFHLNRMLHQLTLATSHVPQNICWYAGRSLRSVWSHLAIREKIY